MKTKCLALAACLFFQLTAHAQALPTKKNQYDFLRWYIKKKDLKAILDTTTSFSIDGFTIKDIDQTLRGFKIGKADRRYINRQILESNTPRALDTTVLHGVSWKKRKDTNTFESYVATKSFISMPIFSKDRKTVFIAWSYSCGPTCGKASIDIYMRAKSGVWKVSKVYGFPVEVF
jgi:hypothetical protein